LKKKTAKYDKVKIDWFQMPKWLVMELLSKHLRGKIVFLKIRIEGEIHEI